MLEGWHFILRLATNQIVVLGYLFLQIVDHAHTIDEIRQEAYGASTRGSDVRVVSVGLSSMDGVSHARVIQCSCSLAG